MNSYSKKTSVILKGILKYSADIWKANPLQECFSNFNVHTNHLEILLRCRSNSIACMEPGSCISSKPYGASGQQALKNTIATYWQQFTLQTQT